MLRFLRAKSVSTDATKIGELLSRGVSEVIVKEELRKALLTGERLRVKLGIDPTSSALHLGNAVLLLKLKAFQELGHTVVFIVGDFTGVVGDTSDKDSERPMLSGETVQENARTYFTQAGKLLDLARTEKHFNSEWLSKLTYNEIGRHADQFSLSDFVARENIKRRLESGSRVSLREVLYPLMQGYDSVAVRADVEIGGTDQRFNLLAGRALQERLGQRPQHILTMNLIEGTDGRKMSKSFGNTIALTDSPPEMFGKVMSIPDTLLEPYFISATLVPLSEVKTILAQHPRDAKMQLASEIVRLYHGEAAADSARERFVSTFREGHIPDDVPIVTVSRGTTLFEGLAKVVASKSEARRLIAAGAIEEIGGSVVRDAGAPLTKSVSLRVGKKRFVRLEVT